MVGGGQLPARAAVLSVEAVVSSKREESKSCSVDLVRKGCLGEEELSPRGGMGVLREAEGC